ncbi:MAG: YifB family Mg chelatase-like AAA ATPase [Candidatus Cryptobacteroides sp.]
MLINIYSAKCIGIEAVPVTVEVDIAKGIGIHLVGLADIAVKESLLRTMTALQSIGLRIPGKKIVINLAPADMHKSGSGYDLPIALGIIAASGQCELPDIDKYLIMGELGLDASLRKVAGALPMAELAIRMGLKGCILPEESAKEAYGYYETSIYSVRNLNDAINILSGNRLEDYLIDHYNCKDSSPGTDAPLYDYMDFSEIIGQEAAKRGLEIAAAGGHNVIMIGAPGSGKSSLAKALSGILPEMTREESIVTSKIYSISGKTRPGPGLMKKRPFRAPHYSASLAAIIGGGNGENIRPGEISLAQNGILFCDEFAQMPRSVTEALRGPLEDRKVVVSRLRAKVEYPASFMLVAATNPCPCGYYGEGDKCSCTVGQRTAYLSRLSGPIMDRIDIQLWLHPVDPKKLVSGDRSESSYSVSQRVLAARNVQRRRFYNDNIFTNSEMSNRMIKKYCPLSLECKTLMENLIANLGLSARAFSRVVKLSRTIADIEQCEQIMPKHIMEAAGYRFLDKADWF